ncbi:MAG TPA: translation initiation factor IF-3 [Actinomycetaceae bacterium]|nr:translation initiation factor IF-3 [Actinomycetaceae bacterium]
MHLISEPRINDRIRVPEVRLVGPSGEQVGVVRVEDALRLAAEADLDLVEVAPNARPPVAKLMDYGKFKYESAVKAREQRRNQANTELKEIRFRLKIDKHDFETKKGHVIRFLEGGDKVKVMIMFRGREQSRPEMGVRLLERLAEDVTEYGVVESLPRVDGRNMVMVIAPLKKKTQAKSEQAKRREAAKADRRAADERHKAQRAARADAASAGKPEPGEPLARFDDGAAAPVADAPETPVSPAVEEPPAPRAEEPAQAPAAPRERAAPPALATPAAPPAQPAQPAQSAQPAAPPPRRATPAPRAPSPAETRPAPPAAAGPASPRPARPAAPRPPAGTTAAPRPAVPKPSAMAAPKPAAPKPAAPKPGAASATPKDPRK